jgi:hypothetical protein
MFFAQAIRKRSCESMMQAFTMATRCGITMDTLLDAQGTPLAPGGSLADLCPLIFTPRHAQPSEINTPIDASEIPHDICAAIGRTQATMSDGWVLVRVHCQGRMRLFVSPAFERDIVTWDTLVENHNSDNPQQPAIELTIPPAECPKCLHTMGVLVSQAVLPVWLLLRPVLS